MLISVEGEEKSGKSAFALTGPLPIVYFSFDMGHERALYGGRHELFKDTSIDIITRRESRGYDIKKDITIYEMPLPVQIDSKALKNNVVLWDKFVTHCSRALEDDAVATVVIDTMTLARRLKAEAYLEELQSGKADRKQLIQLEWGHPNGAVRDIFGLAKEYNKNFIAVHHLTDEYAPQINKDGKVESMLTGKKVLEGLNTTYRHIDVALRMNREDGKIKGKLVECGYDISLVGTELVDITWDSLVRIISLSLGGRIKFDTRTA